MSIYIVIGSSQFNNVFGDIQRSHLRCIISHDIFSPHYQIELSLGLMICHLAFLISEKKLIKNNEKQIHFGISTATHEPKNHNIHFSSTCTTLANPEPPSSTSYYEVNHEPKTSIYPRPIQSFALHKKSTQHTSCISITPSLAANPARPPE